MMRFLIRVKNVHLKPMDVEEAIMQLELLGHDVLRLSRYGSRYCLRRISS